MNGLANQEPWGSCIWTNVNSQCTLTKSAVIAQAAGSLLECECIFHKWWGQGGSAFIKEEQKKGGQISNLFVRYRYQQTIFEDTFTRNDYLSPIRLLGSFSLAISSGTPHYRKHTETLLYQDTCDLCFTPNMGNWPSWFFQNCPGFSNKNPISWEIPSCDVKCPSLRL